MTTDRDLSAAVWVKSSYSTSDGGECVEFSPSFVRSGLVPVRDSKDVHGPALAFPSGGWTGFLSALRSGDLGTA
jgi:hypothetical protein